MKTVALVGKSSLNWELAPWEDHNIDILGLGWWAATGNYPRITAVFEMHKPWVWDMSPGYTGWLHQEHDFPIWMREIYPEIPASRRYPEAWIKDIYFNKLYRGHDPIDQFFTSSIAYMLAMALYQGYERIEIYGVEMKLEKYQCQRDSTFWWMGLANGLGVEIVVPDNSELFINNHYGDGEKPE